MHINFFGRSKQCDSYWGPGTCMKFVPHQLFTGTSNLLTFCWTMSSTPMLQIVGSQPFHPPAQSGRSVSHKDYNFETQVVGVTSNVP